MRGRNINLSLSNIAGLLLEQGADVHARDNDDSTPLHKAAEYGRVEVVQVLLEHVANLGAGDDHLKTAIQVVSEYVNAKNAAGKTPLYLASEGPVYDGNANMALSLDPLPDVVRLLLKHGADVNARTNYGSTPLHAAAAKGRVEVVQVLLEHGAIVGAKDNGGETALQVASNDTIKKLLIEHGAS